MQLCVHLQKPALLGYGVNKQDSLEQGENEGERVVVTELHSDPPLLCCLRLTPAQNASKV